MLNLNFPKISDDLRRRMLEPPTAPVRVVIDTDAANEIDDQFVIAWALLSQDEIRLEGMYAEPFSIYWFEIIQQAYELKHSGRSLTSAEAELFKTQEHRLMWLEQSGVNPLDIPILPPADGMEASYQEILRCYDLLQQPRENIYRGADQYLSSIDDPVRSEAVDHLIERAMAGSSDDPLYIVAIGCITNVAAALLIAPEIVDKIVVTWTAGFPTHAPQASYSFNLEQDVLAAQVVFESGVPLVYLPGFHIGAELRISLPEMERWVRGKGAIGDFLYEIYLNNPLHRLLGINDHFGRTWVIWDMINLAWVMNPNWVPSEVVPGVRLGDDKHWYRDEHAPKHIIREAYRISRDEIFRDFFRKLETAP